MYHFFEAITNTSGDSLPGFYARVINPTTLAVVTLAADNNGTPIIATSGVANMAVTDSAGNLSFYVAPGTYNLEIYAPDTITLIKRILSIPMLSGPKGDKGDPGTGGGTLLADEVDVSAYEVDETDPLEIDNLKFAAAQDDVLDPESENFGKWLRFFPGKGSGVRITQANKDAGLVGASHAIEPAAYEGPTIYVPPIPYAGAKLIITNGDAIPDEWRSQDGDWVLDSWSQNGVVPDAWPTDPVIPNLDDPGNWRSGVKVRAEGARFRRPPRNVLRPYIIYQDAVGTDPAEDVFVGNRWYGGTLVNFTWWFGYAEHTNDMMLNAITDHEVMGIKGLGARSDVLHYGSGSVFGYVRHNKRFKFDVWADGETTNNRNCVSVLSGVDFTGNIYARRFGKMGSATANEPMNPNTGIGAPATCLDVEPNPGTDDVRISNGRVTFTAEDSGASAIATFLLDNDTLPTPIRDLYFTGTATRCFLGLHHCVGGVGMAESYNINFTDSAATDCHYPFSNVAGQGITYTRCTFRGATQGAQIGFIDGSQMQDFQMNDVEFDKCGQGGAGVLHVYGWNGGGWDNLRIYDGVAYAVYALPTTPANTGLRNLKLRGHKFENRAGGTMSAGFVADNAVTIDSASIVEESYESALPNINWTVKGSQLITVPVTRRWAYDDTVLGAPGLEPGSPRQWNNSVASTLTTTAITGSISGKVLTVSAGSGITLGRLLTGTGVTAGTAIVSQISGTTGGAGTYGLNTSQTVASGPLVVQPMGPVFVVDRFKQGFAADPIGTAATMPIKRRISQNTANRFTATDHFAQAASNSVSVATGAAIALVVTGVYSGAGTVYVGYSTTAFTGNDGFGVGDMALGIWFNGGTAYPINSGGAVTGSTASVNYARQFRISGTNGGSVDFQYRDDPAGSWTTFYTVGVANTNKYALLLINSPSESVQVRSGFA